MKFDKVPVIFLYTPPNYRIHTFSLKEGPAYTYAYVDPETVPPNAETMRDRFEHLKEHVELYNLPETIDTDDISAKIDTLNPCHLISILKAHQRGDDECDPIFKTWFPYVDDNIGSLMYHIVEHVCCEKGILPDLTQLPRLPTYYGSLLSYVRGVNNMHFIDQKRRSITTSELLIYARSLYQVEWLVNIRKIPYDRRSQYGLIITNDGEDTPIPSEIIYAASMIIYTDTRYHKYNNHHIYSKVMFKPTTIFVSAHASPGDLDISEATSQPPTWLSSGNTLDDIKARYMFVSTSAKVRPFVVFGHLQCEALSYRTFVYDS